MTTKPAEIRTEATLRRIVRQNLRRRRLELGFSQKALGGLVGVSQPYIARLEHPAKQDQPTFEVLDKLAVALRTTVSALTTEGSFAGSEELVDVT